MAPLWRLEPRSRLIQPALPRSLSLFQNHTAERLFPDALVDGKPATLDHAIETAARLLYDADMPLVYGLSNITCEAQREAVALAELIGGVIDSHTSL